MEPEMLLWLGKKIGKNVYVSEDIRWKGTIFVSNAIREHEKEWRPHTDRAQFADVLIWWVRQDGEIQLNAEICIASNRETGGWRGVEHDSTYAGIMRAAVEAVCRAAGWEGE